ncbi:MAG: hypothetical protein R3345_13725 [Fulvivirga sp.]|nr:hypothetical protein [Fulvivirga sp.]
MNKINRLIFLLVLLAFTQHAFAQKYKVKKGIIYKDKEEVGTYKGEAKTFGGADLTILGKNGEEVLHIANDQYKSNNPFFDGLYWYNIEFKDSGKKLKVFSGTCGESCLIKKLMVKRLGFSFDGSFIKNQDELIAENDISEKIHTDTTEAQTKTAEWIALLENNEILRDKDKPVRLIKRSQTSQTPTAAAKTVYDITQDNVVIGSIVKTRMQSSSSVKIDYYVYEKLYQPTTEMKEVPAGKVVSTSIDFKFYTVEDGKYHEIEVEDDNNAQKALAVFFVEKGYL